MNYYTWNFLSDDSTKFFDCWIEEFESWLDINWLSGEKINPQMLPNPIIYKTDSSLIPEDFPLHSDSSFLVSGKILRILKELNITEIDYYSAKIVKSKKIYHDDYYVLNILNVLDCLDKERSKYKLEKIGPSFAYRFKKFCFDQNKIPVDVKIFRIKETANVFINQEIYEAFIDADVTGAFFMPIEEGQYLFGRYEE